MKSAPGRRPGRAHLRRRAWIQRVRGPSGVAWTAPPLATMPLATLTMALIVAWSETAAGPSQAQGLNEAPVPAAAMGISP